MYSVLNILVCFQWYLSLYKSNNYIVSENMGTPRNFGNMKECHEDVEFIVVGAGNSCIIIVLDPYICVEVYQGLEHCQPS